MKVVRNNTKDKKDQYLDLLIMVMNFDKNISKYFYSEGVLCRKMKQNTDDFVKMLNVVHEYDPLIYNSKALTLSDKDNDGYVVDVLDFLNKWILSDDRYPLEHDNPPTSTTWYYALSPMLMAMQMYLMKKLNKKLPVSLEISSYEFGMQKRSIKWEKRLDYRWVDKIDEDFLKILSQNESLVLVADIRRSQDLITYSSNPDVYMDRMTGYISKAREIVVKYNGLYERSTGDGFVAYFNPLISESWAKSNMFRDMLKCSLELQNMSKGYFSEWSSVLRKIPTEHIGLSIGIDEGNISYREIDNQLFAIGDACVWATRMCDAGHAGEIVLNNIPSRKIEKLSDVEMSLQSRNCITKNGERFVASIWNTNS